VEAAGPGKYRGGLTQLAAVTPYKTERLIWKSQNTAGSDESNAAGIHGGYPGAGSQVSVIRGSGLWEQLRRGEIPLTYEDFAGQIEHLPSKSEGVLGSGDVLIYYPSGGGGYGDPLEREPERVRRDVLNGVVSREWARKRYGVVLTDDLALDEAATERERARQVRERLNGDAVPARKSPAAVWNGAQRLGEYLERVGTNGTSVVRCRRCGHVLAQNGDDPRAQALCRVLPLAEAGPWLSLKWQGHSRRFDLVESICPSCGVLFDVEECLKA
jgi:N-methylhydantoinase B